MGMDLTLNSTVNILVTVIDFEWQNGNIHDLSQNRDYKIWIKKIQSATSLDDLSYTFAITL